MRDVGADAFGGLVSPDAPPCPGGVNYDEAHKGYAVISGSGAGGSLMGCGPGRAGRKRGSYAAPPTIGAPGG